MNPLRGTPQEVPGLRGSMTWKLDAWFMESSFPWDIIASSGCGLEEDSWVLRGKEVQLAGFRWGCQKLWGEGQWCAPHWAVWGQGPRNHWRACHGGSLSQAFLRCSGRWQGWEVFFGGYLSRLVSGSQLGGPRGGSSLFTNWHVCTSWILFSKPLVILSPPLWTHFDMAWIVLSCSVL